MSNGEQVARVGCAYFKGSGQVFFFFLFDLLFVLFFFVVAVILFFFFALGCLFRTLAPRQS